MNYQTIEFNGNILVEDSRRGFYDTTYYYYLYDNKNMNIIKVCSFYSSISSTPPTDKITIVNDDILYSPGRNLVFTYNFNDELNFSYEEKMEYIELIAKLSYSR